RDHLAGDGGDPDPRGWRHYPSCAFSGHVCLVSRLPGADRRHQPHPALPRQVIGAMATGVSWLNPLTWPIEPWVLLGVEITAILYLWGAPWKPTSSWTSSRWRVVAFWCGLGVIVLALDSPLESLARQLFWAHMTQHLLLILVAAPLLVVASPWLRIWRGIPLSIRRPVAKTIVRSPALAAPRRLFSWLAGP